jgi:hypothetical protein
MKLGWQHPGFLFYKKHTKPQLNPSGRALLHCSNTRKRESYSMTIFNLSR